MKSYFKLMRIKHWVKNLLVFLPLLFSGKALEEGLLLKSMVGFFAFSLTASVVYIFNDIHDRDEDRRHPEKKNRPLAKGSISVGQALMVMVVLCVLAAMGLYWSSSLSASLLLGLYFTLNLGYSMGLKCIPLVDVSIIVAGFLLRIEFGGAMIHVPITGWMFLTVMAMSFYLAFGKRRNEIKKSGSSCRKVLASYTEGFLDKMMYVSLGLTVVFYSLWCMVPNPVITHSERLIWSVPLVVLICMKYSMDVEADSHGDPAEVLLGDKPLLGMVCLYGILMLALVYGQALLSVWEMGR